MSTNLISICGGIRRIKHRAREERIKRWIDDYVFILKDVDLSQYPPPKGKDVTLNSSRFAILSDEKAVQEMVGNLIKKLKFKDKKKAKDIIAERLWLILTRTLIGVNDAVLDFIGCGITDTYDAFKVHKKSQNNNVIICRLGENELEGGNQELYKQLPDTFQTLILNALSNYDAVATNISVAKPLAMNDWTQRFLDEFSYDEIREALKIFDTLLNKNREVTFEDEQNRKKWEELEERERLMREKETDLIKRSEQLKQQQHNLNSLTRQSSINQARGIAHLNEALADINGQQQASVAPDMMQRLQIMQQQIDDINNRDRAHQESKLDRR